MAKSEVEKRFTAWERKQETAKSCFDCAKFYFELADEYEAKGDIANAKNERKWAKVELRKAEKYQAEADALFTDDVKKERDARENFLSVFSGFINEWAVKFVDYEEEEHNRNMALNHEMWDKLKAAGEVEGFFSIRKNAIFKEYKEKYGTAVANEYRMGAFDRDRAMKNELAAVTFDVLKMRYRVVEYVGTAVAIDSARWAEGGLEGIVTGTDGKCYLRGIMAGGWNIQRLHVRMIVTKLA